MRGQNVNSYLLIRKALDASSIQGKVISNNITNFNTKGYKRRYVTFDEALKSVEDNMEMKKTNEKHMDFNGKSNGIEIKKDEISSMKEDGNNVDIETEVVNEAANALMYEALVTEINNRIIMRRNVIKGGR